MDALGNAMLACLLEFRGGLDKSVGFNRNLNVYRVYVEFSGFLGRCKTLNFEVLRSSTCV